jgi:uncharacterized protein (DUF1778 family)
MGNKELSEKQIIQHRLAVKKYHEKLVDIRLRVSPEERDRIQNHATVQGESMAAFLRRAVAEAMERDESKQD